MAPGGNGTSCSGEEAAVASEHRVALFNPHNSRWEGARLVPPGAVAGQRVLCSCTSGALQWLTAGLREWGVGSGEWAPLERSLPLRWEAQHQALQPGALPGLS